jgi:hypothetical protein
LIPSPDRVVAAGAGRALVLGEPSVLPNMRLKLAGLSFLKESECCALARTNCRSTARRPAGMSPAA